MALRLNKLFLWKLTRNGSKYKNYILGSLHHDFDIPEELYQIIRTCDEFVMECNHENIDAEIIQKLALFSNSQSLKDIFPADYWPVLVNYIADHKGYNEDFLKKCKPWFLQIIIDHEKPNIEKTMDVTLKSFATEKFIPITFLETAKEFCENAAQIPFPETNLMICETLDDPDSDPDNLHTQIEAYLEGDGETLKKSIFNKKNLMQFPESFKTYWTNRNLNWLPRIIKKIEESNSFIMVGVGHLIGIDNLIELLKGKGIVVEDHPL